jgi:2-phospho-L-lactate/phosphoenolpyruvate guanylyltransferase
MKVFAIVPVKRFENAKTRLSLMLSPEDRIFLSSVMLQETLRALASCRHLERIIVVSSDERAKELTASAGATYLHEEKDNGVNAAVELADRYSMSHHADTTIVIPQDLPLLDAQEISMACDLAGGEDRCIVICPSQRYDGTNMLLRKPPEIIRTSFDRNSYENHIAAAKDSGVEVRLFLSKKLMLDIDTPDDARMLVHDKSLTENKVLAFIKQKDLKRTS